MKRSESPEPQQPQNQYPRKARDVPHKSQPNQQLNDVYRRTTNQEKSNLMTDVDTEYNEDYVMDTDLNETQKQQRPIENTSEPIVSDSRPGTRGASRLQSRGQSRGQQRPTSTSAKNRSEASNEQEDLRRRY